MPSTSNPTWLGAFDSRADLHKHGDNALGLFALALRFGIVDLDSVAADSIVDGGDDKKCDMIFIDYDEEVAVVAQCYRSRKEKASAPANKACDLNTAVTWLLQRPLKDLPERLKSAAEGLRDGIADGTISELQAWYVHNLPESTNVADELETVEQTMKSAIERSLGIKRVRRSAHEIGKNRLDDWYRDTLSPILVGDEFDIPVGDGFQISSDEWAAYVTAIPAKFLHTVYRKYKTRLFSANVRDYLGSRRSDANINHSIKQTAESDGPNFWAYNNGLTILVHDFSESTEKNKVILTVTGMSIVNGAQTTGAIGSMKRSPDEDVQVPVRFVKTSSDDVIHSVIRYNNSQNRVTASDFRSNDKTQKRLREEISRIPNCEYQGGRRGGHADAIKRPPNLIPSYTAGQALAAFNKEPSIAYHQKTAIWESDNLYSRYFNDNTNGAHVVFAFSLLRAVEARKIELVEKSRSNTRVLTSLETRQLEFFRRRGSTLLFAAAVAACLETVLGKRIANTWRLSFGYSISPASAIKLWTEIIAVVAPFAHHLATAFEHGLKSAQAVENALGVFESLVESTCESNRGIFNTFKEKVLHAAQ
jgi:hypothetical protein